MGLQVRTILKANSIHRMGLFADQNIRKGQVIWKFDPLVDLVVTKEQLSIFGGEYGRQIKYYAFMTVGGKYILVCDNTRFINFSSDPNVQDIIDIKFPSVAKRDIKIGEELTR